MNGLTHCVDTIHNSQHLGSYLFVEDKTSTTVLFTTQRLIIDNATRTCTGVAVIAPSGTELSFYATHEVIFSQGIFENPKLLMLSGVGPAAEFAKHGLDVIVDSPHVGQHLLSHPGVPFVLCVKDGFGMDNILLRPGPRNDGDVSAHSSNKAGPVGSGLLGMVGSPRIDKNINQDPFLSKGTATPRA